jgi:hypothetical protein
MDVEWPPRDRNKRAATGAKAKANRKRNSTSYHFLSLKFRIQHDLFSSSTYVVILLPSATPYNKIGSTVPHRANARLSL